MFYICSVNRVCTHMIFPYWINFYFNEMGASRKYVSLLTRIRFIFRYLPRIWLIWQIFLCYRGKLIHFYVFFFSGLFYICASSFVFSSCYTPSLKIQWIERIKMFLFIKCFHFILPQNFQIRQLLHGTKDCSTQMYSFLLVKGRTS